MSRRAFTIVELVTTVGIVALLLAILVPGLRAASAAARTTACASNLRQVGAAAAAYEATNGSMPAAILYFREADGVRTVAWDFEQRGGEWSPGPLWSYAGGSMAIQQCPDFDGPSTFGADPYTGYNYNTSYVGHEGSYPTVNSGGAELDGWDVVRPGRPSASFASPSTVAVFGDGGWRGGANKFMRAPSSPESDPPMACAGTQAFRHWGGCTCTAHLDGHVATHDRAHRGARSSDAMSRWITDYPANGFLSQDDSAYGGD